MSYDIEVTILTKEEEIELVNKYNDGDEQAMDELIVRNIPFVKNIVNGRFHWANNKDDLMTVGLIGLKKAITKYQLARGARLITYAKYHIVHAINKELYKNSGSISLVEDVSKYYSTIKDVYVSLHSSTGFEPTPEDVFENTPHNQYITLKLIRRIFPHINDTVHISGMEWDFLISNDDTTENVNRSLVSEWLTELLDSIKDERSKLFIIEYYFNGKNLSEIGRENNLTHERVRQILKKALHKMRDYAKTQKEKRLIEQMKNPFRDK